MLQQISGKIVRNEMRDGEDDITITVIASVAWSRAFGTNFSPCPAGSRSFLLSNDKSYKTKTGAASFDRSPVFSFMLTVVTIKSQAFRYLTDSPWPSALWGLGCVKFISLGCLSP